MKAQLIKAMTVLTLILVVSVGVALVVGTQRINFAALLSDPFSRTLFFRLRLPRVLMGLAIGASLALVWRPWRWPGAYRRRLPGLDFVGAGALALLVGAMFAIIKVAPQG